MIGLLIALLIIIAVFASVWWVITLLPLPAPFMTIAQVVIVLILALVLIEYVLLPLASYHGLRP